MSKVIPVPGTTEISEPVEPQIDFEALADAQQIILERWQALGQELRRRSYDLPWDIRFEIDELIRETRE
jgi:hypothetical protein